MLTFQALMLAFAVSVVEVTLAAGMVVIPGSAAAPPGSAYPRALQLPGSAVQLVCVGQTSNGNRSLVVYSRNTTDANATWSRLATVVTVPSADEDLANCNLVAGVPPSDAVRNLGCDPASARSLAAGSGLAQLRVFATYRHHTGCMPSKTLRKRGHLVNLCLVYRIASSTSLDGAVSWSPTSVLTQTALLNGVWEPFGFWGPAANMSTHSAKPSGSGHAQHTDSVPNSTSPCVLRVAYSLEYYGTDPRTNLTLHEQLIAAQDSADLGQTWGAVETLQSTPGSRNGMPALARMASDGSWLLVMEGFWSEAGWGRFTVNLARSTDGARSFTPLGVLYAPVGADGSLRNAGSPQIIACPAAGSSKAVVSMMTNDDSRANHSAWPNDAFIKISVLDISAPSPLPAIPVAQFGMSDNLFWPGLAALSPPGGATTAVAVLWGDPAAGALIGGLETDLCAL